MGSALEADVVELAAPEAREHGDGENLEVVSGPAHRCLDHGPTTRGVNGEVAGSQAGRGAGRPLDGVWNVVKLQVQKEPAALCDLTRDGRALAREQLQPDLE